MSGRRVGPRSIITIIVATLVVGAFSIMVSFGFYIYFNEYQRALRDLKSKSTLIADRLTKALETPVWNFMTETIEKIVDSEMQDADIQSIDVIDDRGGFVYRAQDRNTSISTIIEESDAIIKETRNIEYSGRSLGVVMVSLTNRNIQTSILRQLRDTLFAITASTIMGATLILFIMERSVMRRIVSLKDSLHRFAAGDYSARSDVRARDELGQLAVDFNDMATSLQRHNQTLESMVKERTEQLVESEKLAFLGTLVAGVAHEINTPAGICVTASSHLDQVIRDTRQAYKSGKLSEPEFVEFLDKSVETTQLIEQNLRRVSELVRSFKEIAADQAVEERRLFDLKAYLSETLLSLRPKLKHTPHTVILDCPEGLRIFCIPGSFYRIITNLVINSLVHGFESGVAGKIEISIAKDGDFVQLIYRDNGQGIPEEFQKNIFVPFFTTKRGKGGTGLGLYIVHNTVVHLGGTVTYVRRSGPGVEFRIRIPVGDVGANAAGGTHGRRE